MRKGLLALVMLGLFLEQKTVAAPILTTVSPTKANGTFIAGTGVPGNNFWVDTAASGESVALKARGRDSGNPLSISGNTFFVSPGLAGNNISPWWSFDYQFSPGTTGAPANQYTLTLQVDFDPTPGVASFVTISMPVGGPSPSWQVDSDGFFLNPGSGVWSDDNVPYVNANSAHLGFAFWQFLPGALPYNPNAPGEYQINLFATLNNQPVASTTIFAQVGPQAVPEQSSWAVMAITFCGAMGFIFIAQRRRPNASA